MTNVCDGCIDYMRMCLVKKNFKNYDDCPCGNCIIKVMCEEICERRHRYFAVKYNRKEEK